MSEIALEKTSRLASDLLELSPFKYEHSQTGPHLRLLSGTVAQVS